MGIGANCLVVCNAKVCEISSTDQSVCELIFLGLFLTVKHMFTIHQQTVCRCSSLLRQFTYGAILAKILNLPMKDEIQWWFSGMELYSLMVQNDGLIKFKIKFHDYCFLFCCEFFHEQFSYLILNSEKQTKK